MKYVALTHNEFIEKVNTKFPDYFNHVELLEKYVDSKTHFKVKDKFGICNIQPSAILKGRYPTILSAINKSEYFKNKIQDKHNTNLDFSLMRYENANSNLKIICPIHGIFEIGVEALLKSGKCTKCIKTQRSNEKRLTQEEFIKKANQIHNNKYDYSKTGYTIRLNKIIITCPIHGDFETLSRVHLQGSGCVKCSKINSRQNVIDKKSNIVIELQRRYKDQDFKILYIDPTNIYNVIVQDMYGLCSVGIYELQNIGTYTIQSALNKTEYWSNQIDTKFKGQYYYISGIYQTHNSLIKMKCLIHGISEKVAKYHIKGCRKCSQEIKSLESTKSSAFSSSRWVNGGQVSKNFKDYQLYIIECWNDDERFFKIGKTYMELNKRFHRTSMPYQYKIVKSVTSENGFYICNLEHNLHFQYKKQKYTPSIAFSGQFECFSELPNLQIKRELN